MATPSSSVMSVAGSDLVEWSHGLRCWREELNAEISYKISLAFVVIPEAHELAGCRHGTSVIDSRSHGHHGHQAGRHVAPATVVITEASVGNPRGHGDHWPEAGGHLALARVVPTPAGEDALRADGAAVIISCCQKNRGAEPQRHVTGNSRLNRSRRRRPPPSARRCGRCPLQPSPRDLNELGRRIVRDDSPRSRPALHWPSQRRRGVHPRPRPPQD